VPALGKCSECFGLYLMAPNAAKQAMLVQDLDMPEAHLCATSRSETEGARRIFRST